MSFKSIDVELAMDQLGGSEKLYMTVVLGFYERYRHVDQTIEAHMNANELEDARRVAHSIKGLSGNLGATLLREKALKLEVAIRDQTKEQQVCLKEFSDELVNVIKEVKDIIDGKTMADEDGLEEDNGDSFVGATQVLIKALSTYRYSEVKVAREKLYKCGIPETHKDAIDSIMNLIDAFEYDLAIDHLRKVTC